METGFVILHRKIFNNPIWNSAGLVHLFMTLLLMACHKEERFIWNGKEQILGRGQLLTGRYKLAEMLNTNPNTIKDRLKILQNLKIITIKSTNKFSIITIVKYSQYQDKKDKDTSKNTNQTPTRHQQDTTYNNVNNVNNNTISDKSRRVKKPPDLGTFPRKDYISVGEAYMRIKGVELKGSEWLPIQKETKIIFKSGRTVEDIIKTMEVCNTNYDDWSMNTVRMKIADVVSGKLSEKTKAGDNNIIFKKAEQL